MIKKPIQKFKWPQQIYCAWHKAPVAAPQHWPRLLPTGQAVSRQISVVGAFRVRNHLPSPLAEEGVDKLGIQAFTHSLPRVPMFTVPGKHFRSHPVTVDSPRIHRRTAQNHSPRLPSDGISPTGRRGSSTWNRYPSKNARRSSTPRNSAPASTSIAVTSGSSLAPAGTPTQSLVQSLMC